MKSTPANLRDMIAIVTSEDLQEKLFRRHAPSLKIDWSRLPPGTRRYERAQKLAEAMDAFARASERNRAENTELFRHLNAIALVSSERGNASVIADAVGRSPRLKRRRDDWMGVLKDGAANIAAFVNLEANDPESPGAADARRIWEDLLASASAHLKNLRHSPLTRVLPSPATPEERAAGLRAFEDELKLTVADKYGRDRFLVVVAVMKADEIERYVVKTPPLDHEVPIVKPDGSGFVLAPDNRAAAFEILYDETHHRLSISQTSLLPARDLLRMFARTVLKTDFDVRRKLWYDKALQVFRTRECYNAVLLPESNLRVRDTLWVSSLDVKLRDDLLPTTYRGDEGRDVFAQIEQQVSDLKFPLEGRTVTKAVVVVRLHKSVVVDGRSLGASSEAIDYAIEIGFNRFAIARETKCYDKEHLALFERLKHEWGFDGETDSQRALSPVRDGLFGLEKDNT